MNRSLKLILLANPPQMGMFKLIWVFQAVPHNPVEGAMP